MNYSYNKIWNIFIDIKNEKYYKPLRVNVNALGVKSGPPLSPILILNRLDSDEFCRLSNELSFFLLEQTPTALLIKKNSFDNFFIDLKTITSIDLLDWILDNMQFNFSIVFSNYLLLYKFIFLRIYLFNGFCSLFKSLLSILGTLSSLFPGLFWIQKYGFFSSLS